MKTKQIFSYALVAIVAVVLFNMFGGSNRRLYRQNYQGDYGVSAPGMNADLFSMKSSGVAVESSPMPSGGPRMTTLDTHVVLIVKNIENAMVGIEAQVRQVGGFVVSKNQNSQTEGGYGFVSARVPRDKVAETVSYLKTNSAKVISIDENGNDITEQFKDTQARLATLYETKTAIEQILASATASKDLKALLEAQREVMNIQSQIDQEKGQENYLKEAAQTTLISAEFRTDEYALPYNPDTGWAPDKVFKNAVRSLVLFARSLGTVAIWALVYTPVLAVGAIIAIVILKQYKKYTKRV